MNSCHKLHSSQCGFGLLEALVALVLLSSVGFTLLAWVQQNLDTTYRLREFYIEQEARRVALDWVRTLNPMDSPEGETRHRHLRIHWKSTPETQPISQTGYPQGIGKHEIALYKTKIQVFRPDDNLHPLVTEEITTIGHQRAGNRASPFN